MTNLGGSSSVNPAQFAGFAGSQGKSNRSSSWTPIPEKRWHQPRLSHSNVAPHPNLQSRCETPAVSDCARRICSCTTDSNLANIRFQWYLDDSTDCIAKQFGTRDLPLFEAVFWRAGEASGRRWEDLAIVSGLIAPALDLTGSTTGPLLQRRSCL